jgi:hypothetical protein
MAFNDGFDVRVQMDDANFLHAQSGSMSLDRDTREIVTKDTVTGGNQYRRLKLGKKGGEFTVSCLVDEADNADLYNTAIVAWNAGTQVSVDFGRHGNSGSTIVTVDCFITNVQSDAEAEGEHAYNVTLSTTGDFTISTVV